MKLMEHQKEAVDDLGNGKILHGDIGVGKGATALGYYMANERPRDIYVITTAKKRESLDWQDEAMHFGISMNPEATVAGALHVDSWNNIGKYIDITDAFFIFDEQRLVGKGAWVKAFQKIAKSNRWIMLSATPGDNWLDYVPVFIANGFYKNRTQFIREHVVYEAFAKFPKVKAYLNETKLELLRNEILVEMPYARHTTRKLLWTPVEYDVDKFQKVYKDRWNVYEEKPIQDVAEMWRLMRRVSYSDRSRLDKVRELAKVHPKLIVFYNFNYELDILRTLNVDHNVAEWNGHKKMKIPDSDSWIYLVQYVAGAEGWNCIETDAMVLYSLTYSYKNFYQAQGRIDRLNTQFLTLFYYILISESFIDRAVRLSLENKENFNERKFSYDSNILDEWGEDLSRFVNVSGRQKAA